MAWRGAARTPLRVVACAVTLSGCAEQRPADPFLDQARSITASRIRAIVAAVADDSMRGRMTPSPELDRMAAYAAETFSSLGLNPGMATSFLQVWSAPGGSAPNVVAVLDGTDQALRNEYVTFVAHMDHIGTVRNGLGCVAAGADSICNGADDNGSGVAAVVELARAYAGLRDRPRRSMIFLLVSGEEEGLLGSRYFVAHPAVPLGAIVAAVNFDMISRNARDTILVVGADRSSLGALLVEVSLAHPDLDIHPAPIAWLSGSDHASFDSGGVPSLFLFAGLHQDFHRPSDAVDRIDADKEARVVRLAFYLGLEIANRPSRPVRSVPAAPSDGIAAP
jgi:hypothetical protein